MAETNQDGDHQREEFLKNILRYIDATVVLNNMLIDFGDDVNEYDCDSALDIRILLLRSRNRITITALLTMAT